MDKRIKLTISVILPLLIGFLGSFFTSSSISTWYPTLVKPSFNPPNWLFGPVWTLLYMLMGVSFYLIWSSKSKKKEQAMVFFGIQLLLNFFWSIIFFGLQSMFFAFVEILILWMLIMITIFAFYKISRKAAYLLIPYLIWVSFAAVLNASLFLLNI